MTQWIDSPESSNIIRFGHDGEAMVLYVEYKNGSTYQYFDVGEGIFEGMKAAPSKGQFVAQSIKGKYRYARV